jgi:hypothetical protein
VQRGNQADAEGHRGRDQQTCGEDDGIDACLRQSHDRRRAERDQRSKRPGRDHDSRRATGDGQHSGFGQALLHQLPRPRTQGSPDRQLAPAERVPSEEQSRHVRTRDDENQAHGPKQYPQRAPRATEDVFDERCHRDAR